ncbi:hypothetical protein HDV01_002240 [Terramyces sp. JEL0728]|nr:hypothetical protein HDV01_002240 [Terramyces sp. JEL0728]
MSKWGHAETALLIFDLMLQIYGISVTFAKVTVDSSFYCVEQDGRFNISLVRMVTIWEFVACALFFLIVGFLMYGSKSKKLLSEDWNNYILMWKRRFEWLLSSSNLSNSDGQAVLTDVSMVFADYFKDVDWAPSDIAVGLILLKREQKIAREVAEARNINPTLNWNSWYSQEDIHTVDVDNEHTVRELPKIKLDIPQFGTFVETGLDSLVMNEHEKPHSLSRLQHSKGSESTLGTFSFDEPSGSRTTIAESIKSKRPVSDTFGSSKFRNAINFFKPEFNKKKFLERSRSVNLPKDPNLIEMQERKKRLSQDWSFGSYAFATKKENYQLTQHDILDVIHFSHYANMAYVQLDNEITRKLDMLVHYSPLNDLFKSPYMVSLDHDWNSIVIAIRGTYSASDILVDLKLDQIILDTDLPNADLYTVHSGFYLTAKNIVDDMIANQVLENIVGNRESKIHNYHIVVCGHSLGAAVGALVAYFLRKRGYFRTRCYGYSMPGGVANELTTSLFDDFCISVVAGDDSVSRTTHYTMDILKADVVRLLDNCDLPKYKIFGSAIANRYFHSEKRKTLLQRTRNGNIPDNKDTNIDESEIEKIRAHTLSIPKKWRSENDQHFIVPSITVPGTPMFIPGRILYLEKLRDHSTRPAILDTPSDGERRRRRGKRTLQAFTAAIKERVVEVTHIASDYKYAYTPRWASKDEFQEIIISRTMISDHTSVFGILKVFEQFHPDLPLKASS